MTVFRFRAAHLVAIAAAGLAALTGCGGATSTPGGSQGSVVSSNLARDTSPQVAAGTVQELASDNTRFAFNMYQELSGEKSGNLFYSPYSISLALAMTYAGARGKTATQMAHALDFSLPPSKLHLAFDKLDLELRSRTNNDKGVQLDIADSLWGDSSMTFNEPFLDTLATDYGAAMHVVDFASAPQAARTAINSWVADQTNDKITNLLGPGSVTPLTRLVLVNAIYFDAAWETAFDPSNTELQPFTRPDGSTVQANEMFESEGLGYAEGSNYQAVEIPYSGDQTSMVVVLPAQGALKAVESELTGGFVSSLFGSLQTTQVDLSLPKFTIHGATISLKQELEALGMTDAFDDGPDTPDLSGIAGQPGLLCIENVLHQAYVKVSESGTEAAAATATTVGFTAAAEPTDTTTVNVDRPFLVLIRDIPTSSVLFVGRVTDPTAN